MNKFGSRLRSKAKRYKIRLTVKRRGKRVYKTHSALQKEISRKEGRKKLRFGVLTPEEERRRKQREAAEFRREANRRNITVEELRRLRDAATNIQRIARGRRAKRTARRRRVAGEAAAGVVGRAIEEFRGAECPICQDNYAEEGWSYVRRLGCRCREATLCVDCLLNLTATTRKCPFCRAQFIPRLSQGGLTRFDQLLTHRPDVYPELTPEELLQFLPQGLGDTLAPVENWSIRHEDWNEMEAYTSVLLGLIRIYVHLIEERRPEARIRNFLISKDELRYFAFHSGGGNMGQTNRIVSLLFNRTSIVSPQEELLLENFDGLVSIRTTLRRLYERITEGFLRIQGIDPNEAQGNWQFEVDRLQSMIRRDFEEYKRLWRDLFRFLHASFQGTGIIWNSIPSGSIRSHPEKSVIAGNIPVGRPRNQRHGPWVSPVRWDGVGVGNTTPLFRRLGRAIGECKQIIDWLRSRPFYVQSRITATLPHGHQRAPHPHPNNREITQAFSEAIAGPADGPSQAERYAYARSWIRKAGFSQITDKDLTEILWTFGGIDDTGYPAEVIEYIQRTWVFRERPGNPQGNLFEDPRVIMRRRSQAVDAGIAFGQRRKKVKKKRTRRRKVHFGSRGGRYIIKNGRKKYIS